MAIRTAGFLLASTLALAGCSQHPGTSASSGGTDPYSSANELLLPAATPETPAAAVHNGVDSVVAQSVNAVAAVNLSTQTTPNATLAATTRSALIPGNYKPSTTTAGAIAGTSLTKYNTGGADLVITKDGTVLQNLDIYGDIKVRAKNVVIRNSILRGGTHAPANATGIVDSTSAAVVNLIVEDSTIRPIRPHHNRDGIVGHDYSAKRNNISLTNDGLGIFNRPGGSVKANVLASGNRISSLTYWDWSPFHSDGTHNDGIQVQGGENIHIIGNNIDASSVAGAGSSNGPRVPHAGIAIMLQQNVAKLANVVVEKNWVDNGQTSINIANGKYSNITVTVRENRLGRNQMDYGNGSKYPIRIIKRSASTVHGLSTNRWADNNVLLREGRDLGIRYNG
ncbi:hypothetical protein [Arthrobacter sp. 260]|uniref:hypothetical protein n=1 Tax=Arthrobacter sp. 260 TaxID=2735314 RepID=UPI001492750D|nr:hypothetical protein [Arthrobacter sp. 260]NOJ60753.1 hypothetical protein [Arthrobacter sp. 260]